MLPAHPAQILARGSSSSLWWHWNKPLGWSAVSASYAGNWAYSSGCQIPDGTSMRYGHEPRGLGAGGLTRSSPRVLLLSRPQRFVAETRISTEMLAALVPMVGYRLDQRGGVSVAPVVCVHGIGHQTQGSIGEPVNPPAIGSRRSSW